MLKYRYEISIVDILTLLKNIDMVIFENIDIDIKSILIYINIDKTILETIDIDTIPANIDIDRIILKILILIRLF